MPDCQSSPLVPAATLDKVYTKAGDSATPALRRLLQARIAADGPQDFAVFMAAALYHPDFGYYARDTRQVGCGGDFFTSVSVGPLFGGLLARRFGRWWREAGRPQSWRLIEAGGHTGTLAADILAALRQLDPAAFGALEYAFAEPMPRLQAAQRETLRPFAARVLGGGSGGTGSAPVTRHRLRQRSARCPALPGRRVADRWLAPVPGRPIRLG